MRLHALILLAHSLFFTLWLSEIYHLVNGSSLLKQGDMEELRNIVVHGTIDALNNTLESPSFARNFVVLVLGALVDEGDRLRHTSYM